MQHERELTLHEILTEPIIRQVMKADGVMTADILKLFSAKQSDDEIIPAYICCQTMEACLEQA